MNLTHCATCGVELHPKPGSRRKKFCSHRCRKRQYDLTCVDCGGRVDGTSPGRMRPEPVCRACSARHYARWTPESVVAAIQRFAARYGRPPTAADFNPPMAIRKGRPEYAETFHRDGDYPYVESVQRVFGSWNAGIVAAGFSARKKGVGDRRYAGDDPARVAEAVRLYAEGLSYSRAAAATGISVETVHRGARAAGIGRSHAEAQRLRYEAAA